MLAKLLSILSTFAMIFCHNKFSQESYINVKIICVPKLVSVSKIQSESNKGTLKSWLHLYFALAEMCYSIRHIFDNIPTVNYCI